MRALITGDGALATEIADRFDSKHILSNDLMMFGIDGEIGRNIMEDIARHGEYDVVVNCYGINSLSWIGTTEEDDPARIFHCNVILPYLIVDHLVAINHKPCRVVNIASMTYRVPQRCTSLYCASKAALVMMTKVMARELAQKGWIINAVAPGKIVGTKMTEMTDEQVMKLRGWTAEEADKYAISNIPVGRFTTPYEVTEAIMGLIAMPEYVNGICLDVTGGI